jgi:hypothetical protein
VVAGDARQEHAAERVGHEPISEASLPNRSSTVGIVLSSFVCASSSWMLPLIMSPPSGSTMPG